MKSAKEKIVFGFVVLYWVFSRRRELAQSLKPASDDPLKDSDAVPLSNHAVPWGAPNRVSVVTVDDYDYDGKASVSHTALPLKLNN